MLRSDLMQAGDASDGFRRRAEEVNDHLPGAISQGETVEEALANVREAAELYLEDGLSPPRAAELAIAGMNELTTNTLAHTAVRLYTYR